MAQAMFIIGILIGVTLSATVALFGVLSMDGQFGDNVKAAAAEARLRLTGRHRRLQVPVPGRNPESDARVRGLQEEIKVMQRLVEQGRAEREAHAAATEQSAEQLARLEAVLAERDQRNQALEASLKEEGTGKAHLRDEVSRVAAELAAARRDVRDLETELSVARSGASFSSVSGEVEQLRRERDELASRLERDSTAVRTTKEGLALVR